MTQTTPIQRVILPTQNTFKHKIVALFKRQKSDVLLHKLHRYRATTSAKAA